MVSTPVSNLRTIKPLTPATWPDFERLFGANGACAGCWCTWWRLTSAEFTKFSKDEKKNVIRTLVQGGTIPGLIAYVDDLPAGWVSVGPRESFAHLERSKMLARVDDKPVWCINCFFIDRHHRRKGLSGYLIEEAVKFAKENGASIIEAYPIEAQEKMNSLSIYYGVANTFRRLGFKEVDRREKGHVIVRLEV